MALLEISHATGRWLVFDTGAAPAGFHAMFDTAGSNTVCERLRISIRSSQQIEAVQATHCNSYTIGRFFERYAATLNQPLRPL
jgi:hypothetical protein